MNSSRPQVEIPARGSGTGSAAIRFIVASLPPVLVIAAQLLAGVLFGFLGFALATPLLAVAMVLIKRLYVEDRLGDSLEAPASA